MKKETTLVEEKKEKKEKGKKGKKGKRANERKIDIFKKINKNIFIIYLILPLYFLSLIKFFKINYYIYAIISNIYLIL